MTYKEYLKEIGIDKNIPTEIKWSETARGVYCPTCLTGDAMESTKCKYCGQKLIPYLTR